jgi:phosphoglycolate phosphatase-like HAD superfamily hydrolase
MSSENLSNLRLAFFDIDGTLIRRDFSAAPSLKSRAFNYALNTIFGLGDLDYRKILGRRLFGLTDRTILKKALLALGYEDSDYYAREDALFEAVDEYFESHCRMEPTTGYYPLPGIQEFLNHLRENHVRLGLVTGNIRKHSLWKMRAAGFDGYFSTGGFGDDAEERADILRAAIQRNADIVIQHICHFGDSPPDLEAARACGIRAVAISDQGGGTHTRDELAAVGYGLIVGSWNDGDLIALYLR